MQEKTSSTWLNVSISTQHLLIVRFRCAVTRPLYKCRWDVESDRCLWFLLELPARENTPAGRSRSRAAMIISA